MRFVAALVGDLDRVMRDEMETGARGRDGRDAEDGRHCEERATRRNPLGLRVGADGEDLARRSLAQGKAQPRRGGRDLFEGAAHYTGKRGGFAAPSARTRKTESVVMFFLVPFVRLKQVFDLDRTEDRALDDLVRNIMMEWNSGSAQA